MSTRAVYAVRARFDAYYRRWLLENLVIGGSGEPRWARRPEQSPHGYLIPTFREDETEAKREARELTRQLSPETDIDKLNENGGSSIALKLSKAIVSWERRDDEETLMLDQARRRNAHLTPPSIELMSIPSGLDEDLSALHALLTEYPYLRTAVVGRGHERAVHGSADGLSWRRLHNGYLSRRGAEIAHRARISDGFGIDAQQHWGKTKAAIRAILLPRAIELLQLEPMRALLADALARGEHAVVLDRFVFWYEPDGNVGWTVKELGSAGSDESEPAEWAAGTILSKNYGRIVVLPFTKESGERVSGYTRNGPGDGPAKPRPPHAYKEIPFARLKGDVALGLLGELPYGP